LHSVFRRDYNSIRPSEFYLYVSIFENRYVSLILPSPMKLSRSHSLASFREKSRDYSLVYDDFAREKFTLRSSLFTSSTSGDNYRNIFRSSTYVRFFFFGAIPLERYTEHSSDLHGRSTCYARPCRRVPFSCTCPLYSLCICSPSLSPSPLHHLAFASLLLIRPRTGRSTRRHDVFHKDVTSGTPVKVPFSKNVSTRM